MAVTGNSQPGDMVVRPDQVTQCIWHVARCTASALTQSQCMPWLTDMRVAGGVQAKTLELSYAVEP
jgi:hypothetical protein